MRKCVATLASSSHDNRTPVLRTLYASTFACATTWCVAASGQAKPSELPPEWPTRVSDCGSELADALPSVVGLEVDALLREHGLAAPPESVAIQCNGDRAQITVSLHGTTRDTIVDLGQLAAPHRARAIALAAAELLHSLASAGQATARPRAAAASEARPRSPTRAAPTETTPLVPHRPFPAPALLIGALGEWLGKPATPLFGARIALRYPLTAAIVPALSADASFGSASTPSAHVIAKTFGVGAHLYFETRTQNLRWSAGPGARIARAELVGHPSAESTFDGRTLTGLWGGPEARARIEYGAPSARSAHAPLLALELGVGVVTLPLRGLLDGAERIYSLNGPWLSLCVELGLEL